MHVNLMLAGCISLGEKVTPLLLENGKPFFHYHIFYKLCKLCGTFVSNCQWFTLNLW